MVPKSQILSLYKSLLKESQKFSSYNFRSYAVRKVRDAFRENKGVTDSHVLNNKLEEAYKSLELIKRQALISQMYQTDKLVIEKM
ncbi:LYR motif-containing protein 4 [Anthonomus grandis grandis]|uniref:LYR motif-containing protein 4 n=1 Tax=Anthonomus grandis grandis TaxID=2921223 RepID=UPI002165527A|nr:LYR motif-containing protein 4 [Anthonomus grandis grandis]